MDPDGAWSCQAPSLPGAEVLLCMKRGSGTQEILLRYLKTSDTSEVGSSWEGALRIIMSHVGIRRRIGACLSASVDLVIRLDTLLSSCLHLSLCLSGISSWKICLFLKQPLTKTELCFFPAKPCLSPFFITVDNPTTSCHEAGSQGVMLHYLLLISP